jgi:hypothetical protein
MLRTLAVESLTIMVIWKPLAWMQASRRRGPLRSVDGGICEKQ